ncbi:50S ribosomal protein L25 [Paenibacillus anaericanus]|uniref:Large ribosomal subunit protein bL25 n=1 Tax=Paenibacillus anaericanus TaxID=170367 RepID=A0A433XZG7_9BACL|nr:50S ribosomal protein L25 [Paenibacillus anaericanus]RUT40706.1 50S ribosomal protein L25 [Paenibacillus anaericanus]
MGTDHQTLHLNASKRTKFTNASLRELRENGQIPAVVYGVNTNLAIHVDEKELRKVSRTGRSEFFELKLDDGGSFPALIKDIQQRGGRWVHVDFLQVSKNKPIRVKIPLHYNGTAEGTKGDAILQVQSTELEVEGLPDALPAGLDIDVTPLGVGDKLTAAEVSLPEGVTLVSSGEELLASVITTRGSGADTTEEAEAPEDSAEEPLQE